MNAYNIFYFIYRRRLAESISGNIPNKKGLIDLTAVPLPSNIITEEDINGYFGRPSEDRYYDESFGNSPRPDQNTLNLTLKTLSQQVAVAWKAIDPSSRNILEQRAKMYRQQYRVKNKQWKEKKEEEAEIIKNVTTWLGQRQVPQIDPHYRKLTFAPADFTWNTSSVPKDEPTTSCSTTPKTTHALRSQKQNVQERSNVTTKYESNVLAAPSSTNGKHASSTNNVIYSDALRSSTTPYDISASDLFDDPKIDNAFDDDLSFKSEMTNVANVAVQHSAKLPDWKHRHMADSGTMDPIHTYHTSDPDRMGSKGERLRYVTPEPIQLQGKNQATKNGREEIHVNNHPPELFGRGVQQSFRGFVPSKRLGVPPPPNQGMPFDPPECRRQASGQTRGYVDHFDALRWNHENVHPPTNENYRLHSGVPISSDFIEQRIDSTNERTNQFVAPNNNASRIRHVEYHSSIEHPPPTSSRAYSHSALDGFYSSGSLSPPQYHSHPIQYPVSPSLPAALIRLKNSLAMMDDPTLAAYSMYQNHHRRNNSTPDNFGNSANYYAGVTPDTQQNENQLCACCHERLRRLDRFELEYLNPYYAPNIDMWLPSLLQMPNEGTSRSDFHDGRAVSHTTQVPHLFECKPPAINRTLPRDRFGPKK